MNYEFPTINNISDVLPHIEGRTEFIVAQREEYQVINYNVAFENTFEWDENDPLGSAMRRECRGLIFDLDGNLLSRPFHKFFNLNEREETLYKNIDFNKFHIEVQTKEDGSMVRGILLYDGLHLCTKMGITKYSLQAQKWLDTKPQLQEVIIGLIQTGFTPIFEWVSPANKVVLTYTEEELVLLAIRHTNTGEYVNLNCLDIQDNLRGVVKVAETDHLIAMGKWDTYTFAGWVHETRQQKNMEGFVLTFDNGHKVKIKTDWYVELHKLKESFQHERNVVRTLHDGTYDDKVASLKDSDDELYNKAVAFEKEYARLYNKKFEEVWQFVDDMIGKANEDKKTFAVDIMPTLEDKHISRFVFKGIEIVNEKREYIIEHELRDMFNETIDKNLKTLQSWQDIKGWLGMTELEWVY